MNDTRILFEFKNSLIAFFDELITQFPEEGDLIIIRIFLNDQIPIKDIMDDFILLLHNNDGLFKKMVKDRNENFFLEYNIFGNFDKLKIIHFKRIWRSGRLDEEDKEVIWKWVDSFVYIADKYVKTMKNT